MISNRTNQSSSVAEVSIIIPAFNAASTIEQTVASVLSQSLKTELVIVDDGSRDETLTIARQFESAATVVTGPNRGVSAARNAGIAASRAPWLIFLDSDDLLEPNTLERRLARARETRADVVITDWIEVTENGEGQLVEGSRRSLDWASMGIDAEIACATSAWATTAAILYSREIVAQIGSFKAELPIIQDARFLFDAAYHGARIVRSEHIGAQYRMLPGSLSRCNPAEFARDVFLNAQEIEALWRKRGGLTPAQTEAISGVYGYVTRALFSARDPTYFDALVAFRRLGAPTPLHHRVASPLARLVGLTPAQRLLSLFGRG